MLTVFQHAATHAVSISVVSNVVSRSISKEEGNDWVTRVMNGAGSPIKGFIVGDRDGSLKKIYKDTMEVIH